MFKINIHNLKEGEHKYEFTATAKDFDFEDSETELNGDVLVKADLFKIGSQMSIKVYLKGKFKFNCDRCTEDYIQEFDTVFDIIYKFEFRGVREDEITDDDDIKFIPPNTIFIDIKEDVRDFILLSIPMKKAPEVIEGVCTYCNRDTNEMLNIKRQEEINPVWEKLLKQK